MKKMFLAAALLLSLRAFAGNVLTVTNTNDSGAGSLRDLVSQAASGDTIRFSLATYPDTIQLLTQIPITVNLSIIGLGNDSTRISGKNGARIFGIAAGDTVLLERLLLFRGAIVDSGGAIYSAGALTIRYCDFADNTAGYGGAILSKGNCSVSNSEFRGNTAITGPGGAALSVSGSFVASNCTFDANQATATGSAGGAVMCHGISSFVNSMFLHNGAQDGGGAIRTMASTNITNCLFSTNTTAFNNGGALMASGVTKITACTFDGNVSSNGGGGAISSTNSLQVVGSTISDNNADVGGGIWDAGSATIVNSSIYDNLADNGNGGGIFSLGSVYISTSTISSNDATNNGGGIASTVLELERTTITKNKALGGNGGGIYSADTLRFSNTIVGSNICSGTGPEIFNAGGTAVSLGHNLVTDNSESDFTPVAGDIVGTEAIPVYALLDPLANNGGTTLTHLPQCTSPAIDAGDSTGASLSDQAGRPRVHGEQMDIGSVEVQTDPVAITAIITNESTPGAANGSIEAVVDGGTIPYSYTWNTGSNQNVIAGLSAGLYGLTVSDFHGCLDSAVFTISIVDGIADVKTYPVTVYPNPVHDFFRVDIPFVNTGFEIIDISGKVVQHVPASAGNRVTQFDVRGLPNGNYILKYTDGKKVFTGNFVKE